MRGLAALGVMLYHFGMQLRPGDFPTKALQWVMITGPRLELFFVLSGFLVTGLLYDAKNRPDYYRNFYARRMLRILPLYYAALIVLFVVPYLVSVPGIENYRIPLRDQLPYWFYVQNFQPLPPRFAGLAWHFWSLAIEQQFYLVWPIVILKTSRTTALKICVGLVLMSILYRVFGNLEGVGQYVVFPTPARLDGIAIGSAIALIMRGSSGLEPLRRRLTGIFLLSVAFIATFIVLDYFPVDRRPMSHLYFTFTGLFFGSLLIYAIHAGNSAGARIMKSPALAFFGKYGYGLYVLHVPIVAISYQLKLTPQTFAWIPSQLVGSLIYVLTMIGLSTGAALLSWHLWEKQFLKLKPGRRKRKIAGGERAAALTIENRGSLRSED